MGMTQRGAHHHHSVMAALLHPAKTSALGMRGGLRVPDAGNAGHGLDPGFRISLAELELALYSGFVDRLAWRVRGLG